MLAENLLFSHPTKLQRVQGSAQKTPSLPWEVCLPIIQHDCSKLLPLSANPLHCPPALSTDAPASYVFQRISTKEQTQTKAFTSHHLILAPPPPQLLLSWRVTFLRSDASSPILSLYCSLCWSPSAHWAIHLAQWTTSTLTRMFESPGFRSLFLASL